MQRISHKSMPVCQCWDIWENERSLLGLFIEDCNNKPFPTGCETSNQFHRMMFDKWHWSMNMPMGGFLGMIYWITTYNEHQQVDLKPFWLLTFRIIYVQRGGLLVFSRYTSERFWKCQGFAEKIRINHSTPGEISFFNPKAGGTSQFPQEDLNTPNSEVNLPIPFWEVNQYNSIIYSYTMFFQAYLNEPSVEQANNLQLE